MFLNLKMFQPDFVMERVEDINLVKLKDMGYESIILDLDNTLVGWRSKIMSEPVKNWVLMAREAGFKLCIVSNCLLKGRVRYFGDMLSIPFVFKAIKPRKKAFVEAVKILETAIEKTVVIGDQVFTDVFGGNRMGFLTILVLPVDKREFYATLLQRTAEKIILSGFRRKGLLRALNETESREEECKKTVFIEKRNEGKK